MPQQHDGGLVMKKKLIIPKQQVKAGLFTKYKKMMINFYK